MRMAEYDLDCPCDRLELDEIDAHTIAVRGCGRQTEYVKVCRGKVKPWRGDSDECQWFQN